MSLKTEQYDRVTIFAVTGDFDGPEADEIRQSVEALGSTRAQDFIVDLESAPRLDSAALEALTFLRRHCESAGGDVKIAGADENCRKILQITRLANRFECCADVPAALKSIRAIN